VRQCAGTIVGMRSLLDHWWYVHVHVLAAKYGGEQSCSLSCPSRFKDILEMLILKTSPWIQLTK
jgi:hypothetical protein